MKVERIFFPNTESQLFDLLNEENVLLNGGTDLMVRIRLGRSSKKNLISLDKIPNLDSIVEQENNIIIQCKVTHTQILNSSLIKDNFPILFKTVYEIGSTQIRNKGTLVGNVVNASPAGDGLLALYLLDAQLQIKNKKNQIRTVDVSSFVEGPGKTSLKSDEYVYSISIPKLNQNYTHHFFKVGQRKAMAISIASLGVLLLVDTDYKSSLEGIIKDIRIAFGSVAPTVLRLKELESVFIGQQFSENTLKALGERAEALVNPIDDIRATAIYRKRICANLPLKLLNDVK